MDREYELFYIVRPDLDEEQVRGTMDEVAAQVVAHGGEVGKSSLWGRRRLAYTVAGFNDGFYVLKEMKFPAERVRELERQLKLDERVIRHLISLKQVYYLPGDEDRRGRVRGRSRDRSAAAGAAPPQDGEVSDVEIAAEVAADDGYNPDQPQEEEPAGAELPADEPQEGEE